MRPAGVTMRMPNNVKRASAVDLNVSCYSNCRKSGTDTDGSFWLFDVDRVKKID